MPRAVLDSCAWVGTPNDRETPLEVKACVEHSKEKTRDVEKIFMVVIFEDAGKNCEHFIELPSCPTALASLATVQF
jgi:hypothetical protein